MTKLLERAFARAAKLPAGEQDAFAEFVLAELASEERVVAVAPLLRKRGLSAVGTEVRKTWPAVIVSNDASNAAMRRVQVVPVTSNTAKLYVFEAPVTVKGKAGKAMADQVMTADKQRLKRRIGKVSAPEMLGIERSLRIQLGLR